jgi:hypothetical protein
VTGNGQGGPVPVSEHVAGGLLASPRAGQKDAPRQTAGRTGLPGDEREAPAEEASPTISFDGRLHVIAYRATLDVPGELAWFAAQLLLAEHHRRGTPAGAGRCRASGRRFWGCAGSATAPPAMLSPVTTASPAPPPTGTRKSSSRCRRTRPRR